MTDREQLLDELRPLAFAIAYRMLGSVSEAEDVVQEALLRVHQALDDGERGEPDSGDSCAGTAQGVSGTAASGVTGRKLKLSSR
jgi:hypothetical protein